MLLDVGRICCKTSGREAGNYCVIVNRINDNLVLIDGYVRRKKCNIKHLEPLDKIIKVDKDTNSEIIKKLIKESGLKIKERKIKRSPKMVKQEAKEKHETKEAKKPKEIKS